LWITVLAFFCSFLFVAIGYDFYRYGLEATVLRVVRPHGVWVELEREWVVKDHGPLTLGGWLPLLVRDTPQLTKRLRLPDLPATTPGVVRLAIDSEHDGATVVLRLNDGPWLKFNLRRGLQWIDVGGVTAATASRFTVQAQCDSPTVWFMVDAQRAYGRTHAVVRDRAAPPGEWVVELSLAKPSPLPPASPSSAPKEPPHE